MVIYGLSKEVLRLIKKVTFLLAPSEKGIQFENYTYLPPLSLGTLGGYLKQKGFDVQLYDLNINSFHAYKEPKDKFNFIYHKDIILSYINGDTHSEIEQFAEYILREISFDDSNIVGISCGADFSFFQLHSAFIIGKYIERKYNIPVVIGGNNISYITIFKDTFKELIETVLNNFKYVIKGPGAVVMEELIHILNKTSNKSIYDLNGLIYIKNGEIYENPEQEPCVIRPNWLNLNMEPYYSFIKRSNDDTKKDLNSEKENDIHLFKWPFYLSQYVNNVRKKQNNPEYTTKLVLPYIFNYRCPYACAFCSESDEVRKKVIIGDVNKVIEDISYLMEKYDTNYFYFFNNATNDSGKFIDEFCKQIINKNINIKWSDCARFNNMTFERLKLIKEAGCRKLVFGFETASQKLIDLVDKKIDLSHGEQVMKWCNELGILVDLEVIIGLPQERDEDFEATIKYINKNKEYINYMTINEFFVVPNSKIGRYPKNYGIELVPTLITYDKMLKRNLNNFISSKSSYQGNFKIYKYNEINGRNYREVAEKNRIYLKKINGLQNKEFDEVEYVYRIIEGLF